MATRWYLTDGSNSDVHRRTGPTASQLGETDASPSAPADKNTCKAATATPGALETSRTFDASTGSGEVLIGMFATPPLGAQTLAGGASLLLTMPAAKEGLIVSLLLSAGFYSWRQAVGKVAALGGGLAVDESSADATQRWRQIGVSLAGDVVLANGDQIVCEVWGTYLVNAGTRSFSFYFNGATDDYATAGEGTDVTDSAAWFESSQTLKAASHPFFYPGADGRRGLKR